MIVTSCFLPFVGYFITFSIYFSYFMISEEKEESTQFKVIKFINWLIAVAGTAYFLSIEVR